MTAKGESLLSKVKLGFEYQEDPEQYRQLINRIKQIKRRRTLKKKEKEREKRDSGRTNRDI